MRFRLTQTKSARPTYLLDHNDREAIRDYFTGELEFSELRHVLGVGNQMTARCVAEVAKQWIQAKHIPEFWTDERFMDTIAEL